MFHEHSRSDRDKFVEVDLDKIKEYETQNYWPDGYYGKQYRMCTSQGCRAHNPYDYDSLMHYGPFLQGTNITVIKSRFLCNNKPCPFGQRIKLSFIDKKDIFSLYGCREYPNN